VRAIAEIEAKKKQKKKELKEIKAALIWKYYYWPPGLSFWGQMGRDRAEITRAAFAWT
jgi:hypothetical protein